MLEETAPADIVWRPNFQPEFPVQYFLMAASAAVLLAGCSGQPSETAAPSGPTNVDKAQLTADAKAAVMAFGSTLKTQLQTAMKTSGPAAAVDVCHKIAPTVAESLSQEHGVTLTRVSLKNRNPDMGVPSEWQRNVLQDFETRKAAGEAPATLVYSEVVDGEHRFMKAIPTEAICLNCHGVDIKPAIQAKIDEYYPNDRAVGFQEGDIRGAFVAVRALNTGR